MTRLARWAALVLVTGCGRWETVTVNDEGELCFEQRDGEVAVVVRVADCLQGGCWRDLGGECSAMVDGNTIELTSEVTWDEKTGMAKCDADCGTPSVECSLGAVPDGTYSVIHGDQEVTVVVPVEGSCL